MPAVVSPVQIRAPRRRRRRLGLGLLFGLGLWLVGRGTGWFGGGEERPQPASGVPAASLPQPNPPTPPLATDAAAPVPLLEPGRAAAMAPDSAAPAADPAPPRSVMPTAPTLDPDRFASQLSLVTERTARGELGSAMVSLQHLRQFELDAAQRAALAVAADRLEASLAAASASIVQALWQGRALAAREALRRLGGEGEALVEPWLRDALRLAGCPVDPLAPAVAGVRPLARPLGRGREVRWRHRGRIEQGRVVDSRSEALTVRVQRGDAVVFPTLAVIEVEPVEVRAEEAVELAFAALAAGDPVLARLWLCCARQRRAGAPSPREQQLATLLP